jgi:chromate transporter
MTADAARAHVGLRDVLVQWGRIGCIGFGGPPTHISLLRELCVEHRGWMEPEEFEDAIAACNLLPGPASTQLAILCAWNVAGPVGAIVGGVAFVVPGLLAILGLAAVFLAASPPTWVLAAGAGAGAAVAAVAVHAALGLAPASWSRARVHGRWIAYALAGGVSAATVGPLLVGVLLLCGAIELALRTFAPRDRLESFAVPLPLMLGVATATGGLLALAWVGLKVGALSYGGGFVIIPLMQHDAVDAYHWMTNKQFLDAVALGQITPGPVVHTVAVVGYAAAGVGGGLLAAVVAFAPSFVLVLVGARHFQTLRTSVQARAFLDGAGPAAIGAIFGVAMPLALALEEAWQVAVLAAAAVALLALRRSVVLTLLLAAAAGIAVVQVGAPLP